MENLLIEQGGESVSLFGPTYSFMKFAQNNHPTRLFGPTRLIGTWEYTEKSNYYILRSFWDRSKELDTKSHSLENTKNLENT